MRGADITSYKASLTLRCLTVMSLSVPWASARAGWTALASVVALGA
jgi:hypothetical protein